MKAKVLCLPFDPDQGFAAQALDEFCEGRELLSVGEHLIEQRGRLWWALLLTYREDDEPGGRRSSGQGRGRGRERPQPGQALDAEEQKIYDGLRSWRTHHSAEEGVPPFMICNNQQLADIVRLRPSTAAELQRVPGFGEGRVRRHGGAREPKLMSPGSPHVHAASQGARRIRSPTPKGSNIPAQGEALGGRP